MYICIMKSGRFHGEIWQISWQGLFGSDDEKYSIQWYTMNPVDFMVKSGRFHEI